MGVARLRGAVRIARGMLDHRLGLHRHYSPWGFAMNGMTARLEATRQLIFACGVSEIVETGTYRGTTTEWFAQFGIPVLSIELHLRFFTFSRRRVAAFPNVTVRNGDSSDAVSEYVASGKGDGTLFYLDAHWNDHLPLQQELEKIFPARPAAIVLIDDFSVPGDPGYGYDDYGPGKALTTEYLDRCALGRQHRFFPAVPAAQETGHRRGWVVLTGSDEVAAKLAAMPLLRG